MPRAGGRPAAAVRAREPVRRVEAGARQTPGGGGQFIMSATIETVVGWIRRRAENVVAGLLGIMFVAFIIQIVFRYFFNFPIGWSSELSVVTWLYMTLLGSAFWLKESDDIRFDLLSGALGPVGRRVVGLVVAI